MIAVSCLNRETEALKPVLRALIDGEMKVPALEHKLQTLFQIDYPSEPEWWGTLDPMLTLLIEEGFLVLTKDSIKIGEDHA